MNNNYCYVDNNKFYYLNPINPNNTYRWKYSKDKPAIHYLFCEEDKTKNLIHRLVDPAIEFHNGTKYWFMNGIQHNDNSYAYYFYKGYRRWYYHGQHINCQSQEEFEKIIKMKAFI